MKITYFDVNGEERRTEITEKIINLVRKCENDDEIIQYINDQLKKRFILGFNFDDAYRVLDSYWMHGDEPYYKNTDLVSLVKEITKEDNYYRVICFFCAKELDLLSIESPYKTCPSCKKELNYWRDFGLDELSGMPSSEIYLDYIEKNAERIYRDALRDKAINRVSGESDLDVFKELCLQLFKKDRISFRVYPWHESDCVSWLYTDILEDLYKEFDDDEYDWEKRYKIDTDQLLYDDKACFEVKNWKNKITLLKAFNGKIDLSIGKLNPRVPVKYTEPLCYLKMDWTESSRNIPKKKFLYSMPYCLIYPYFFVRNLFFTLFFRPTYRLKETYYEFYYNFIYKLKKILRIKGDPPF